MLKFPVIPDCYCSDDSDGGELGCGGEGVVVVNPFLLGKYVSGVCSVGCPTVGALWFNATSMALGAPLGDLRSAIAVECNAVCFFDIVPFT